MQPKSKVLAVTIAQLPTFTNSAGMTNVPLQDVINLSAVQTPSRLQSAAAAWRCISG